MPKPKSNAFERIRAEVLRLIALIPEGRFTTYGSLAVHMNVTARHVAFVLSSFTDVEAAELPWHRVVGAEGRISPNMPPAVARKQKSRLRAEGMKFDPVDSSSNLMLIFTRQARAAVFRGARPLIEE